MTTTNTYTKLNSGDWGIRVAGKATSGQRVIVTKKSGESKTETVSKVLWADGKISLCSIERGQGGDSTGRRISTGESYRAGVTAPGGKTCPYCGSRECARAWNPNDLCDED